MSGQVQRFKLGDSQNAGLIARPRAVEKFGFVGRYDFECFRPDGTLRWAQSIENLVVNEMYDLILALLFPGSESPQVSQPTNWYLGLVVGGTSPVAAYAAGDTMSSHAGWTEFTNYTGANSPEERPAFNFNFHSGQSISNSGNAASFSINTNGSSIIGAFLTTGQLKGGTTGRLGSAGNLDLAKSADSGDTVSLTYTLSKA